jgi:hypothetical protein
MAKLTVHGGDFRRGDGWFYPGGTLVLRNSDGKPESISLAGVEIAGQASGASLRIYGGDEVLHADFEQAKSESETGKRIFIACLADGRLLLASTDQESFEEICTPRQLEAR